MNAVESETHVWARPTEAARLGNFHNVDRVSQGSELLVIPLGALAQDDAIGPQITPALTWWISLGICSGFSGWLARMFTVAYEARYPNTVVLGMANSRFNPSVPTWLIDRRRQLTGSVTVAV